MSAEENKTLIRRYFDLFNQDWNAALNEYVADEELAQHIQFFETVFPNYQLVAEDMVAEGDKVVVRTRMHGRHQGSLMAIAPTGKEVTMPFMIIYRVANGKIVQHWLIADQMGLMQQLGAMPVPEAHGE
jgi:predicted ester cyclase